MFLKGGRVAGIFLSFLAIFIASLDEVTTSGECQNLCSFFCPLRSCSQIIYSVPFSDPLPLIPHLCLPGLPGLPMSLTCRTIPHNEPVEPVLLQFLFSATEKKKTPPKRTTKGNLFNFNLTTVFKHKSFQT